MSRGSVVTRLAAAIAALDRNGLRGDSPVTTDGRVDLTLDDLRLIHFTLVAAGDPCIPEVTP